MFFEHFSNKTYNTDDPEIAAWAKTLKEMQAEQEKTEQLSTRKTIARLKQKIHELKSEKVSSSDPTNSNFSKNLSSDHSHFSTGQSGARTPSNSSSSAPFDGTFPPYAAYNPGAASSFPAYSPYSSFSFPTPDSGSTSSPLRFTLVMRPFYETKTKSRWRWFAVGLMAIVAGSFLHDFYEARSI